MNSKMIADGILRAVAVITVILIICYFFFKISTLLIYITIAVIISLIGRPVVVFLRTRLKMRNTLSVILTMVFFLGIVIGIVLMFIPLLIKQGQNLSLLNIDALQQNRTMVITPGWIRFFPNLMAEAGWDEVDVRQNFGRYDRFLLMDTGINPLSEEEILAFYDLTQVPIEIQQISLDHFRAKLIEVLR